jgi:hypothetical protein
MAAGHGGALPGPARPAPLTCGGGACRTHHPRVRRTPVPLPLSPVRGGAAAAATPGPAAPSPAPAGSTPIAVKATKPNVQPIAALNPYDTQWTIKVGGWGQPAGNKGGRDSYPLQPTHVPPSCLAPSQCPSRPSSPRPPPRFAPSITPSRRPR